MFSIVMQLCYQKEIFTGDSILKWIENHSDIKKTITITKVSRRDDDSQTSSDESEE